MFDVPSGPHRQEVLLYARDAIGLLLVCNEVEGVSEVCRLQVLGKGSKYRIKGPHNV